VKNNATNLFDSYIKSTVYVLDYATGSKAKHAGGLAEDFAAKREMFLKIGVIASIGEGAGLDSDPFISGMLDNLRKMADEKDAFTAPEHIIEYIKKDFLRKEKGVLFLQMERGMGKTTLARALDQLAMNKIKLDDGQKNIAVRAYYIDNMFSYRINHFLSESCNHILTNMGDLAESPGDRIVLSSIALSPVTAGSEDMGEDFAQFLNALLEKGYKEHTTAEKLVFIIDGMDEIRFVEGEKQISIFDCIPDPRQLADGVYIILAGRHGGETSRRIQEKYASLANKSIDIQSYKRNDG
jgi:energy-coupling factor transporter ATP-binding protein EcfA2